ncbi:hypothetical protein DE4576_00126 [Mycobacterium marinum]|uniref:hypothetical protein n=1 Tax=Mycobacterium marinum TaxID=1781 RepID=UPI000E3B906E|nr:hypothetical protein [Mycobacterium marinum]MDC9003692.1 hypothetical protein [Mycobacterium marinum]RFZ70237.1 hypothetical protein DE4576_00126 [Mycobacterium marinum]GJO19943.1 hypothetical protein NJB1507_15070 [Mycobacterium marinum]
MLSAIAIIPSAPVLVPELTGLAGAEVADLRSAVVAAASSLPNHWVGIGVGPEDQVAGPDSVGTFAGFGVDVQVRLAPALGEQPGPPSDLPLCALLAGWVRGQIRPAATAKIQVYAHGRESEDALVQGKLLRAEIDRTADPVGVLVVADGVNTLTPSAPGGYDPTGAPAQLLLDDALAGGDVAALARLPERVLGRPAFQVLAGLCGAGPRSATELYRGAPFGVGCFVGVWQP